MRERIEANGVRKWEKLESEIKRESREESGERKLERKNRMRK